MHESIKFLGWPLLLKTDFRELISSWNFSTLEDRLNPLYNKLSIILRLIFANKTFKISKNSTKFRLSVNWVNKLVVLTAYFKWQWTISFNFMINSSIFDLLRSVLLVKYIFSNISTKLCISTSVNQVWFLVKPSLLYYDCF